MLKHGEIAFGDTVRIVDSASTRLSRHSGLVCSCSGLTTPSETHVVVVGDDVTGAVALNVHVESVPPPMPGSFPTRSVAINRDRQRTPR
jgi:hypothetical protein